MISQTSPLNGRVNVSFTTSREDLCAINKAMEEIKKENDEVEVVIEENISKISVVGIGMMNQSGVTGKLFRLLANNEIEFRQVTTSEISISYTIDAKEKEKAVTVLAKELSL
jgi:aspartate kinase